MANTATMALLRAARSPTIANDLRVVFEKLVARASGVGADCKPCRPVASHRHPGPAQRMCNGRPSPPLKKLKTFGGVCAFQAGLNVTELHRVARGDLNHRDANGTSLGLPLESRVLTLSNESHD